MLKRYEDLFHLGKVLSQFVMTFQEQFDGSPLMWGILEALFVVHCTMSRGIDSNIGRKISHENSESWAHFYVKMHLFSHCCRDENRLLHWWNCPSTSLAFLSSTSVRRQNKLTQCHPPKSKPRVAWENALFVRDTDDLGMIKFLVVKTLISFLCHQGVTVTTT